MKPCTGKQKQIALLAADSLADAEARELRVHLDMCDECRGYFNEIANVAKKMRTAQPDAGAQLPEMFHRNLMDTLASTGRRSLLENLWTQIWIDWQGRFALPAAALVAVALAAWLAFQPRARVPVPPPVVVVHEVTPAVQKVDLTPTLANYEMALQQSPDKLDELLTEQANRNPPPPPPAAATEMSLARLTE
jgi:hypothetical protein